MNLYAMFNNNSPVYLSERFIFISTVCSRSTRRGDSLSNFIKLERVTDWMTEIKYEALPDV